MRQYHGIKVGDLVRFKHHIFDEYKPVHLVAEVWGATDANYKTTNYVKFHNGDDITHQTNDFIIVSRS